jgi:flagellar motor protein MotB
MMIAAVPKTTNWIALAAATLAGALALGVLVAWLFAPATGPQPTPPAALQSPPAPRTPPLERIRAAFADEISAGGLTVDPFGGWIAIRISEAMSFEPGRADLLPGFLATGRRIAAIVQTERGAVRVVGHTDDRMSAGRERFKDGQSLSTARAEAVARLLRGALADASRLSVEGSGASEPIASNATAEGRAKNRRVEVLVMRAE